MLTALGLLAVLGIIIGISTSAGGGGYSPSAGSGNGNAGGAPAQSLPGIGTPVRDGQFQFTVNSVSYTKHVGGEFGDTAQGHFAVLHLTVKNIGNDSQTLDDSAQVLFANGHKYDASSSADIMANNASNSVFFNDINPGNTVHGVMVFDMPTNVTAEKAELHDSIFSDGVGVSLRK